MELEGARTRRVAGLGKGRMKDLQDDHTMRRAKTELEALGWMDGCVLWSQCGVISVLVSYGEGARIRDVGRKEAKGLMQVKAQDFVRFNSKKRRLARLGNMPDGQSKFASQSVALAAWTTALFAG